MMELYEQVRIKFCTPIKPVRTSNRNFKQIVSDWENKNKKGIIQ